MSEPTESDERAAERVLAEARADADTTAAVDPHDDRTREVRFTSFTRMRTDWHGQDAIQMASIKGIVESRLLHLFPDIYVLMNDLYEVVREPLTDGEGTVMVDQYDFTIWARTETGSYIEDYSRLTGRQREDFLFRITTNIFEWQQTAADLWGEAMFAKVQWEEAMAEGFLSTTTGGNKNTDEARTQRGRLASIEARYFAIFQSLLSRKSDALVRSMELIGQRLKDVLT